MNIVNEVIENNAGLLTSLLIYREFTFEQATRFLPYATSVVANLVTQEPIARSISAGIPISIATLLNKIDIDRLAVRAAIGPELASAGVVVLVPKLLELLVGGKNGFSVIQGDRMVLFEAMNGVGGFIRNH